MRKKAISKRVEEIREEHRKNQIFATGYDEVLQEQREAIINYLKEEYDSITDLLSAIHNKTDECFNELEKIIKIL